MKVLILGASGMLGHKLYQVIGETCEVYGTIRSGFDSVESFGIFDAKRITSGLDVANENELESTITGIRPDVVINAVGVIKQKPSSKDVETTLTINSIVPHRLAALSERYGFRSVCISTDCVFNGGRGGYTEADMPDALDLYGQSKHWGEVTEGNCLTLRTSIIGHELATSHSLVDWFFSNRGGQVKGFRRAIYSGFPTVTFARILERVLWDSPDLRGLYHLSSEPIDKFSLLELIRSEADLDIQVVPDDDFVIDRSLNSDRFREATGFQPTNWAEMVREMCSDPTHYAAASRFALKADHG